MPTRGRTVFGKLAMICSQTDFYEVEELSMREQTPLTLPLEEPPVTPTGKIS